MTEPLAYTEHEMELLLAFGVIAGFVLAVFVREAIGSISRWQERRRWYRYMDWLSRRQRARESRGESHG